jgi:hypothetical protein
MMSWEGLKWRGVPWIPKKRMASRGNPSERFHDHLIHHNLSHLCRRGGFVPKSQIPLLIFG